MSTALPVLPSLPLVGTTWAKVDTGFHVASRAGAFVGTVDENADGTFVASDARSTPIGRYLTLKDAQRAVDDVARGVTWARPTRSVRMAQSVAVFCGVIAAGLFAGATVMPIS